MSFNPKQYTLLLSAIVLALLLHGVVFIHTMPKTYDAYVHIFFADHYARDWFNTWDFRWYTGFSVTSYPPLLHQLTAILSLLIGLKAAFISVFCFIIVLLVVGVYRFSRLFVSDTSAQYAALISIVAPSIVEAAHVFGQIPTLLGISLLLNALPDVYFWVRDGQKFHAFSAMFLLLVVACSHHVTVIFGQVFFIAPIIGLAIFDRCNIEQIIWTKKEIKTLIINFLQEFKKTFWRIIPFMVFLLIGIIVVIFPYWYATKTDPIAQVSIPHGSRDNFLLKRSSGIIFFVAIWGMLLPIFFYALRRTFQHRNLLILLPLAMLFLFGTGGTTPIPKLLLGANAFNILTLDRFSFWATILTLPFAGEFFYELINGKWGENLNKRLGTWAKKSIIIYSFAGFGVGYLLLTNLSFWDFTQPQTIDIKPIVNFIGRDEHNRWRYLTLGFGDQIAWLSANTDAQCIDGNYHSARRLPELTTRAIERLENAKFSGVEGIGSLQQFLTVPEKYYLKYVFSNDKFYDPILHYTGWNRVQRLENGIMVWEKQDVPKLPPQTPAIQTPDYQRLMWGILPILMFCLAIFIQFFRKKAAHNYLKINILDFSLRFQTVQHSAIIILPILMIFFIFFDKIKEIIKAKNPEQTVIKYYDYLDNKRFSNAHQLFGESQNLSFEQYVLEISVEDGVLNSFAKLNGIETKILAQNDSTAWVQAKTTWITPLSQYEQQNEHFLQLKEGKWQLQAKNFDLSIPPDEAFRRPTVQFFNQGKRRVSTTTTNLEDVLDRPELNVIHARLVKQNEQYSVIGEVQNTDNYPAHLTITAVLYDKNGTKITNYSPMFCTKHKILPKEITPFRIDFEDVSKKIGAIYKPDNFQPYLFDNQPISVKIFAQGVGEEKEIYKNIDLQNVYFDAANNKIVGEVINSGVQEVTIPELIFSFYNKKNEIVWVEKSFLPNSVRPQRKQAFEFEVKKINENAVYNTNASDNYVNGLCNSDLLQSYQHISKRLMPEESKIFINQNIYVKVSVNAFIMAIAK